MKTNRTLNIIARAVNEFGMALDMNDSMQNILEQAMNTIEDAVEYDYISLCDRDRRWNNIIWDDGNGFSLEVSGDLISGEESLNKYYRYENGGYREIKWYNHSDEDYVLVHVTIDTNGQRVRLVAKS